MLLDLTVLGLEYAGDYSVQTAWKGLVYSVKLKLEFSILNKLVELVHEPQDLTGAEHISDNANGGTSWMSRGKNSTNQLTTDGIGYDVDAHSGNWLKIQRTECGRVDRPEISITDKKESGEGEGQLNPTGIDVNSSGVALTVGYVLDGKARQRKISSSSDIDLVRAYSVLTMDLPVPQSRALEEKRRGSYQTSQAS